MRKWRFLIGAFLLLTTGLAAAQPGLAARITVSGVITGPNGPVSNVWIGVGSPLEWTEDSTDASGAYSVSINTNGELWFAVRPDFSTRLAQLNYYRSGVSGSITQNFAVVHGHLFRLRPTGSGGAPITGDLQFEVLPLEQALTGGWFSLDPDESNQRHQAVLPPDIYHVTAHRTPAGYYETAQSFDLRAADLDADLTLNTTYVHPIPYNPPDAAKITVGPPDLLGEATVTGAPGAALPLARVLLVNLSSAHQAQAVSEADGSFSARIYAPPGSALMVKHGPAGWRWQDLSVGVSEGVNPFPGTILNLPHTHTGGADGLPFAAAGAIQRYMDDPNTTRNYVGAAWAVAGTSGPVFVDGEWTRLLDGRYDGQKMPGLYLGGLNWTHPALADLDADGDRDLLVGEREGRLVLYRNTGTAAAPDWEFETAGYAGVDTGGWAYPALADVTGDAAPDLFVGAGSGALSIYYNQGTPAAPAWPAQPSVTLTAGENAAPALLDLDADGDLDLLAGSGGGTLIYFKNTGTVSNPAWTFQTSGYGGINEPGHGLQPTAVNLDGDADLDLLIGRNGDLVWYRNNGPAHNPTWTRMADGYMGFGGSSAVSPAAADWDGDGDRDLVTGEHWGVLRFFRNDGPPSWTERSFSFTFDLAGDTAPALGDWDGDDDLDLLVGQAHGQVWQYTNIGSPASPDWRPDGVLLTLPWTNHPHPFPALADIDGDGDLDLFIGEGSWDGPDAGGTIRYYRNDGSPATPNWSLVTTNFLGLDVGGWSTPAFVDIDADGDLDLFVGDGAGTLTFVQNTGTSTAPAWAAPVQSYAGPDLGDYSAPAFFDLDQDGDLDLLAGLGNGSLAYVRNVGTASSPAWELAASQHPDITIGERATPAAGDLSGDGLPDLLLGDGDGGLNLYRYDGPGAPPTPGQAYAPGDLYRVQGTLRVYGPAIDASTDVGAIAVNGDLALCMQHNAQGQPLAGENYYMSTLLTPTGLPIQRVERPLQRLGVPVLITNLHYIGGHAIEGELFATARLLEDLPSGIYRPSIFLGFSGVPTNTTWLAANVVDHTISTNEAALPPLTVGSVAPPRLTWRLLMDDFFQGTRGTGARQDAGSFELASQITTQGAAFYVPPVDEHTGQPIPYRLEPFLPMISYTDRRMPTPPLIPFDLPGGLLQVTVQKPDGTQVNLGSEALAQSFNRTKTTRGGQDLNNGTVQLEDVYSLKAASDRFRVVFDQYGHHVITMSGTVQDLWGNSYQGGGTYDLWVAHPLDVDPGVLPGTPLAVGNAFNAALQFHPGVPAEVTLTFTLYPHSDPAQATSHTWTGQANRSGYFSPADAGPSLAQPGEYRVDLQATYTGEDGRLYMAAMSWGGVVMTPPAEAQLVAHGRRGLDSLQYIPSLWFVSCRDLTIPPGAVSHSLNPYSNGDIFWSRMSDNACGGDSLILGTSVQDNGPGSIETAILARAARMGPALAGPGTLADRMAAGELPLFISTRSGRPPEWDPGDVDQVAYSYRSSQRPGVRVREVVAEDGQSGGYWRLDTLYDDQLGVGIQGDLTNDFKFQYVGAVYRDLETGHDEYLGQGSGWIMLPESDPLGSRVMPPFAGQGNGGWTTEGGPLLTLKGQAIDIFILPTGTQPGAVLEVGDRFRFAGHIMPTLDSQVAWTVTSPSGARETGGGQANSIGYFYDPADDFTVDEPGRWSVDVEVGHDGLCSGGKTVSPFPQGDVLGSEGGRYWFYVVPSDSQRLTVTQPAPGWLSFDGSVTPITLSGPVPSGLSNVTLDYTISMPGYILQHAVAPVVGATYQAVFDPATLAQDFPNLDLVGRDEPRAGLADTISIGLLLEGEQDGQAVVQANTVTFQGDQVFVSSALPAADHGVYLPLVQRAYAAR